MSRPATPDLPERSGVLHVREVNPLTTTTDEDLARTQRIVKLTAVCHQAKRVVPKTKTFEADLPTQWDCLHEYINDLLTELDTKANGQGEVQQP